MWRRRASGALAIVSLASVLAACGEGSGAPTVTVYIQPDVLKVWTGPGLSGQPGTLQACNKAAGGRYTIQLADLPKAADGQRQQLVRRLAAKDDSIDVMGLDVVWAPEFAEAGWLLPFQGGIKDKVIAGTLQSALQTATWKGQLYGAPDNSNTQLLWYRKDLVPEAPKTWDEMIQQAVRLRDAGKPHLIEVQGGQFESLTVWFNSLVAGAGGRIIDPGSGQIQLGQPAEQAARVIRDLATSPAADPSLSNQREDDNRLAFESGSAAFEINYPFIYPSLKKDNPELFKQIAWAPYPATVSGQQSRPTIGGIDLGVSSYSKHPDLAFDAVSCLRSSDNQKLGAVAGGLPPTLQSLYDDPALREQYPFADTISESLRNASIRPQTPAYTSVSLAIQSALSPPNGIDPAAVVGKLRSDIDDAVNSKGLVP